MPEIDHRFPLCDGIFPITAAQSADPRCPTCGATALQSPQPPPPIAVAPSRSGCGSDGIG